MRTKLSSAPRRSHGKLAIFLTTLLFLTSALTGPAAAWIDHGQPLCTASGNQVNVQLVPDETGGFIAVWEDARDGLLDIYAQRFDETGASIWGEQASPVCTAADDQTGLVAVGDGSGGAYIVWTDFRGSHSDIYAQHINSGGIMQWAVDGVAVCDYPDYQQIPRMVADGHGGAVVVWSDARDGTYDIYAQRLTATDATTWREDGVLICAQGDFQDEPDLAILPHPDFGSTRIMVVWRDQRAYPANGTDVYVQRLTLDGLVQWSPVGLPVSTGSQNEQQPHVAAGLSGSFYVIWQDDRLGPDLSDSRLYLKHFDRYGDSYGWEAFIGGFAPQILPDGVGGVLFISTHVSPDPAATTTRLARYRSDGSPAWAGPVPLHYDSNWSNFHGGSRMVVDDYGRITACYYGHSSGNQNIWTRRIWSNGLADAWGQYDVRVSDSQNDNLYPQIITLDLDHVAVAWSDARDLGTTGLDIYGQRLNLTDGAWGFAPPIMLEVADVPADQGGVVTVRIEASDRDVGSTNGERVIGYNLWRRVEPISHKLGAAAPDLERMTDPLTAQGQVVDRAQAEKLGFPSGDWISLGYHAAAQRDQYLYLAPTAADSSGTGVPWQTYFVSAHTPTVWNYYASETLAGYSVDNLAPGVPEGFAVIYSPSNQLSWWPSADEDFQYFKIYRGATADFVVDPLNPWHQTADTSWQDTGGSYGQHYKISAVDFVGNESEAVAPGTVSGVEDVPGLIGTRFALLDAAPNPFNPSTTIRFELADSRRVFLVIHDLTGRRIRTLVNGATMRAGHHSREWDGRDAAGQLVASGTYFYRLEAGSYRDTRRMMLLK